MKRILLAVGFVLAVTTAAAAQGYVYGAPYSAPGYGSGLYDYAPGYGYGGNGWDYDRSDGPGRGNSAELQR